MADVNIQQPSPPPSPAPSSGGGAGPVWAIIALVIVLFAGWFIVSHGDRTPRRADVKVDINGPGGGSAGGTVAPPPGGSGAPSGGTKTPP